MALLLGYDAGSSSIKATLMDAQTGSVLASATSPQKELEIIAKKPGWAEQNPSVWWDNIKSATRQIKDKAKFDAGDIKGIGISYQMHGLVAVDRNQNVLRPAIIWCDSRAVQIGQQAAKDIGEKKCLKRLLNLPGNFTASKLKWVKDNEPDVYSKIYKIMVPGDYIAMKMSGRINTTPSGLSEGIMWDFEKEKLADFVLDDYGISPELTAEPLPAFSIHGELSTKAADELGLRAGTKITYKGGDQPNNALSLGALEPGDIAVTAGTSGVVCGISDKRDYDKLSRVNTFVHVNHLPKKPRYAVLLCINGAGILNSWLRHNFAGDSEGDLGYEQMNDFASKVPVGSDGLLVFPYGNGAERVFENKNMGASVRGWNFNTHKKAHFFRAAQEGVVFALNYGLGIMHNIGVSVRTARAGNANMFLSPLFAEAFATVSGAVVKLYNTDGSQGAARGAGIGAGVYKDYNDAFVGLDCKKVIEPNKNLESVYRGAYENWLTILQSQVNSADS